LQAPLQLQLPPEQSIVQLAAPLQSALHEPPGQWNVQVAPFSHLYEQLPVSHVVSHVPPAHVQSFPLHVSCWLVRAARGHEGDEEKERFGYKDFRYWARSAFSAAESPRFMKLS
jgi:hypothetical protein